MTNKTRKNIYQRDGFACAVCDDTDNLQIHHYLKRSLGGSDHPHNLITLCGRCHSQAHGLKWWRDGDYTTQQDTEQAICEYLSDLYAEVGVLWDYRQKASEWDGDHVNL